MGDVLIFAEHQQGKIPKSTLSAVGAGQRLAQKLGCQCHAAVIGSGAEEIAKKITTYGVKKVFLVDAPELEHYLADVFTTALAEIVKSKGIDAVVGAATAMGKDLLPRLAARLDAALATDVTGVNDDGTFSRPMYAGNVNAIVELAGTPKVVSIRITAFDAAAKGDPGEVEKVEVDLSSALRSMKFESFDETKSDRPPLTEANIVISGGRALKSAENFQSVLEPLVDDLGAALGATRAAVDAGFVPNDLQVGQTGKVVAPQLYMAFGISGAIQHLAGMKDSKVIVAVNKDPEAPIFQVADYGLVADLFKVIPELREEIKKLKS